MFYASAAARKAASYFNVRKDPTAWKQALAAGRPILTGLNVDVSWDKVPADGLLDGFRPKLAKGGHAVAVVGYRADGCFIIRNSWGEDWGDRGFAYASPAYVKAAFFDEAYVLTL